MCSEWPKPWHSWKMHDANVKWWNETEKQKAISGGRDEHSETNSGGKLPFLLQWPKHEEEPCSAICFRRVEHNEFLLLLVQSGLLSSDPLLRHPLWPVRSERLEQKGQLSSTGLRVFVSSSTNGFQFFCLIPPFNICIMHFPRVPRFRPFAAHTLCHLLERHFVQSCDHVSSRSTPFQALPGEGTGACARGMTVALLAFANFCRRL